MFVVCSRQATSYIYPENTTISYGLEINESLNLLVFTSVESTPRGEGAMDNPLPPPENRTQS